MLTREHVEKIVNLCTEKADFQAFQAHTAPGFVYEFMGTQPYSGEWRGADAVKRQFTAFNDNFTSEFQVTATEIYVDVEKRTAAVRLQSHPLTDKGGGEYRQHCVWFMYFDDDNQVRRIVDYSDTKLVDEMIIRVATAKMRELRR
jgi:ketosteroid isomerase-like protein